MPDDVSVPGTATVQRNAKVEERLAAHYREIEGMREDRDRAIERVKAAEELCSKASLEIRMRDEEITDLRSRMTVYQLERDEAVSRLAKLQERVKVARDVINGCDVPPVPAIAVAPDAEAPVMKEAPTHGELMQRIKARAE